MLLPVAPQIHAHHFAVLRIFNKPSDAVGEAFLIHPARAGTPAFWKNHHRFSASEQVDAFVHGFFHLLAGAATVDGNALGQITQQREQDVVFVVRPFRQIPGRFSITDDMLRQAEHREA